MKNIKIEQLKKELKKMWSFFNKSQEYSELEILNWVADSIVLLTKIGVSEIIIKGLIETFEKEEIEKKEIPIDTTFFGSGVMRYNQLGPFVCEKTYNAGNNKYVYIGSPIIHIKIAYRAAKSILEKGTEEERIVPKYLIKTLEESGNYKNIVSSLELVQTSYEKRDSDSLVKNSITLLDSILDLDESLKTKKEISKKLRILKTDKDVKKKFGVMDDFIIALDNSRIIRNLKSVHKNELVNCNVKFYDIPFMVAVTSTYLIIIFLEITISTGELIKN